MNKDQKHIIVMSVYALGVLLILIFIRVGSRLDYSQSMMLLPLSKVDNPYSYIIGQESTIPWGILARMGITGVIFGIIIPFALFVSATFMKKSQG